ncbi:MAG: methylenetetrahydrofolate dehydrogenase (NADP+)/methenyltetrahydrofolate cyclohydrolase [Myxococcota bacterium]|jgi:methylenetetrahydrofolate dehydrogenase (NADP+)/methenyltetrahydrofolate cyclohydrolase
MSLPRPPGLAVVLVGENPASEVYVRRKGIVAGRLGFEHQQLTLPAATTQADLHALIDDLNADGSVDGILVQLPLPSHLNSDAVLERIHPDKDVDGLTPASAGLLAVGRPLLVPCTPAGCMHLIEAAGAELSGAHAVVLGRSNIVGRPIARLLEQANATVTICHSRTKNPERFTREADVLIAAVGKPKMVGADWVRPGAVVVDVGINRLADGTLCGDVDTDAVAQVAGAITPVPGGVGPMTIAMLMRNTLVASERRQSSRP